MIRKLILASAMLVAGTLVAVGADGHRYQNARYDFSIAIPSNFGPLWEADNGDGGVARSPIGRAELAIWGSDTKGGRFRNDAAFRQADDRNEGWKITYIRTTPAFAVLSGTRDGRIAYQRGMPGCRGQTVFFRLEYDAEAKKRFDPIIAEVTQSFKRTEGCDR